MPNNVITGILEDNQGNLWLSTVRGLSRFAPYNPRGTLFRNYDKSDGLQSNEFNVGAYYKNHDGKMYFGGVNGFNSFYPDSIKDNPHVPPVVLTDFQIFNKSIDIGKDSPLKKSISEVETIILS